MTALPIETPAPQRRLVPLFLLGLAGFLSQFDVTALAVALPSVRASLGLDAAGAAWVIDAYSLAFAAALLPAGYAADGWGRRRMLVIGLAVFGIASAACALSPSGPALWVSRAVQGLGAAMLTCATLALIAGLYPRRDDRLWAFGVVGVIVGVAMIVGPAGGGALAAWLGWPSIFWINPPLCAVLLVAGACVLDEQRGCRGTRAGARAMPLAVVAMVATVWSLLEGTRRGWDSAIVVAPAAVAAVLWWLLAARWRRMRGAADVRPGFVSVCAQAALLSIGYWATLVFLPLACMRWFGIDAVGAGLLMLAATAPMLLLPRLGARLAVRTGRGTLFALGFGAVAAGDALLWRASIAPAFPILLAAMLLAGSGAGLINAQLSAAFVGLAAPAWAGTASAWGITMRQLGYAVGVALLGAVEDVLAPAPAASFLVASLAAAAGALLALHGQRLSMHAGAAA